MRALVLGVLAMGCSPLDDVMDDCGDSIRVTAPKDALVIFHYDDGEPILQERMHGEYVELNAPSCHGAVTVVGSSAAYTVLDVEPGEWLDFTADPVPEPEHVTAVDTWSMRVDVMNANPRNTYAVIEYLFGDDPVFATAIPVPFEEKSLVAGVPLRITTIVYRDDGVRDTVVDELPGVQPEFIADAARAPHIEDVVWNRERRRAFRYQLRAPADTVMGCESWPSFRWCVAGAAGGVLVMPLLPLALKPPGEPGISFTAIDMDGGRVVGMSSFTKEWTPFAAPMPFARSTR